MVSEQRPTDPIKRLDDFIDNAPSTAAVRDEDRAKLEMFVLPMLDRLRPLKWKDEEYQGSRYYYALHGDLKGYTNWLSKSHSAELEYERVWRDINSAYSQVTGKPFPGRKGKSENEQLSEILDPDDRLYKDPREHMEHDRSVLMGFGAGTEKLGKSVSMPEELIDEMNNYRHALMSKAKSEYPDESPERAEERSAILDEEIGFHRTATGVGRAALEAKDFKNAGAAFGFARSVGKLSAADADVIHDTVTRLPKQEKMIFIESYKRFYPILPESKHGTIA